jgi:hypothetical protein
MNQPVLKNNYTKVLFILLLLALILPSRLVKIDRTINIDEPWWVISSTNFYYAVAQRNFEDTYFEYHPGVTNMWIISTALHFYFPEYRGLGQGFFDQRKPHFEEFMRKHGRETLDLVRNSRYIQTGILAILAVTAFLLLSLLVGKKTAFFSVALATISPFFLGHSRLLNMESMLALFVIVSFLGMHVYLNRERRLPYLLVSGAAFGLAQLTKSPSIVVAGLVGLMLFVDLFKKDGQAIGAKVWKAIKTFAIWLGTAALVYVILWPGMWVDPGRMLSEVYGNAFSYAFQGARLDVAEELKPETFSLETRFEGIFQYLIFWASSTTFITWLGLAFAAFFLVSKDKERLPAPVRSMLAYLALLGTLFILMFGVAQGRDSPHYIMSSYVAFDVMAGIGWGAAFLWAQTRWAWMSRAYASIALLTGLILVQIGFGLPYAPYYFTYKNPFAAKPASYGYGEGYAEASDYLAQKPNATNLRAYVHNGMGTFSFYFPGKTLVLKRVYLLEGEFDDIRSDMRKSDYLVVYVVVREKQPETQILLDALRDVAPEKKIVINSVEYLYIYRIADIPESVYDALGP